MLLLLACALATAAAIGLLVAHPVRDQEPSLILVAFAAGPLAMFVAVFPERLRRSAVASSDAALAVASDDWRRPFYLLAPITSVLPTVWLGVRAARAGGSSSPARISRSRCGRA